MKLLFLLLILGIQAQAAPVFNQNMAADGTFVTIWPDHKDPNHFYFAPNFMRIALDASETPKFQFTQFETGNCSSRWARRMGYCHYKALITSLLVAGYEMEQLNQAQEGIRKIRPQARFSPIPFITSKVEFGDTLNKFIDEHECSPRAGQAADQIPCTITFNSNGIYYLMPFLNAGKILPIKFVYTISGVKELADGSFEDAMLDHGLTVNLGGEVLINHPDLNGGFLWD